MKMKRQQCKTYQFSSVQSLSHVQLCNPVDCSLPSSCVHGILKSAILEWVAMSLSRGSPQLRDRTHVS